MNTRQAIIVATLFTLLFGLSACSTSNEVLPTATLTSPPPTVTVTPSPSPIPPTPTPTPLTCLTEPGTVESGSVNATVPPQEFLIYLPPCYSVQTDLRYPVLYLLHGQTYNQDQWVRLGVPQAVDQMIHSGESIPFIVVFPDDRFWNTNAGPGFGTRLIGALIPHIDANYRTLPNRENRALGGLSRGGGWTVQLGLENPNLFGSLGLHSPAIFKDNAPVIERTLKNIPEDLRPRIWLDAGDNDRELESIIVFEEMLTGMGYPHSFQFYLGDHSEYYWGAHVRDYLRWYAEAWNKKTADE